MRPRQTYWHPFNRRDPRCSLWCREYWGTQGCWTLIVGPMENHFQGGFFVQVFDGRIGVGGDEIFAGPLLRDSNLIEKNRGAGDALDRDRLRRIARSIRNRLAPILRLKEL